MRPDTRPWWIQAQEDLDIARELNRPGRYHAACWHAQQAVEKGLKALCVERTRAIPPRTHDLEYLGTVLSVPDRISRALSAINPASDITRYPDQENLVAPVEFIDEEIASVVVTAAIEVMVWLEDQLT